MKLTWQTRLVLLHSRRLLTTEKYKLAVTSLWIEHIDSLTTNFATETDFEVCSYIWSSLCHSQLCELQKGQDESAWWDLHHPTPYISGKYQIPVVYHKWNNKDHVQTIHAWYILVSAAKPTSVIWRLSRLTDFSEFNMEIFFIPMSVTKVNERLILRRLQRPAEIHGDLLH